MEPNTTKVEHFYTNSQGSTQKRAEFWVWLTTLVAVCQETSSGGHFSGQLGNLLAPVDGSENPAKNLLRWVGLSHCYTRVVYISGGADSLPINSMMDKSGHRT